MMPDFFGRSEVNRWRDRHTIEAAKILNQLASDFYETFAAELAECSFKESLFAGERFLRERVDKPLSDATRHIVQEIVKRANDDLRTIAAQSVVWNELPQPEPEDPDQGSLAVDAAFAAGPIAGGLAAAVSIPTIAVTTKSGFLGLARSTTLSLPRVVAGGVVAGVGIATGVANFVRIRSKADARLLRAARKRIVGRLITGPSGAKAELERIEEEFARVAAETRKLF